jgi:protein TonB
MLENSPTKPKGFGRDLVVSLTVHSIVLLAVSLPSVYFPEAIDVEEFNRTVLAVPPALAPPPPPTSTPAAQAPAAPKKARLPRSFGGGPAAARLGVPTLIQRPIDRLGATLGGAILVPEITPGVPGGVPGGQLGGVIGGIATGASGSVIPPPPAAPIQAPIRVGGAVKAPRPVYQVLPIYPPLLEKAKVSGDVVIRVVIDARGNVVEMHPVSGDPQLVSAAMDAVSQWKYEPTIVAGQAVPVEFTVTIQFRPT